MPNSSYTRTSAPQFSYRNRVGQPIEAQSDNQDSLHVVSTFWPQPPTKARKKMTQTFENKSGVRFYPLHTFEPISTLERHCAPNRPIALYIHIPFCEARCYFCTFSIVAGSKVTGSLIEDYMAALKSEIEHFGRRLAQQNVWIETIQVGGGTPTAISADQIEDLFRSIFDNFDCSKLREIIFEGFPGSVTTRKLRVLSRYENLKLNIGVQSFDKRLLDDAGRRQEASGAIKTLKMCKAEGIASLGIDLIYGLPGSTTDTVTLDLDVLAELPVDHLAFYPLWIYEQTTFDKQVRDGKLEIPQFDALQLQMRTGHAQLAVAGFERYTAFHYARGTEHRHSYGQWQMETKDWLGLGMASMSNLQGTVFFNERSIGRYMELLEKGEFETGSGRAMDADQQMRFSLLYGIRKRSFETTEFEDRFGVRPQVYFSDNLTLLKSRGFIVFDEHRIELTDAGIISLGLIEAIINEGVA